MQMRRVLYFGVAIMAVASVPPFGSPPFGTPQALAQQQSQSEVMVSQVIQGQLKAFAAGNRDLAYSYAAPSIQRMFPSPDVFMNMVAQGYGALIAPQSYQFESFQENDGRAVQMVRLTAADGTAWKAYYMMQQMEDGSWRIAGCQMEQLPGGSV